MRRIIHQARNTFFPQIVGSVLTILVHFFGVFLLYRNTKKVHKDRGKHHVYQLLKIIITCESAQIIWNISQISYLHCLEQLKWSDGYKIPTYSWTSEQAVALSLAK